MRVLLTGLTIAEYFTCRRSYVLLFIDNIFRFTQAGSEVSALLGRMPSAVGYQPTGQVRASLQPEGVCNLCPAPATAFAHLDSTTNLERK